MPRSGNLPVLFLLSSQKNTFNTAFKQRVDVGDVLLKLRCVNVNVLRCVVNFYMSSLTPL